MALNKQCLRVECGNLSIAMERPVRALEKRNGTFHAGSLVGALRIPALGCFFQVSPADRKVRRFLNIPVAVLAPTRAGVV